MEIPKEKEPQCLAFRWKEEKELSARMEELSARMEEH